MNKADLRRTMKRVRAAVTDPVRKSQQICEHIVQTNAYATCDILLLYLSIGSEVSLNPLIEQAVQDGKEVAVPRITGPRTMEFRIYDADHLESGAFHTIQPDEQSMIAKLTNRNLLMLAPGLAFTIDGKRLGYGGGYYDTWISKMPSITVYGICFEEQIIQTIPVDEHDITMDGIVTPGGYYDCLCTGDIKAH